MDRARVRVRTKKVLEPRGDWVPQAKWARDKFWNREGVIVSQTFPSHGLCYGVYFGADTGCLIADAYYGPEELELVVPEILTRAQRYTRGLFRQHNFDRNEPGPTPLDVEATISAALRDQAAEFRDLALSARLVAPNDHIVKKLVDAVLKSSTDG